MLKAKYLNMILFVFICWLLTTLVGYLPTDVGEWDLVILGSMLFAWVLLFAMSYQTFSVVLLKRRLTVNKIYEGVDYDPTASMVRLVEIAKDGEQNEKSVELMRQATEMLEQKGRVKDGEDK